MEGFKRQILSIISSQHPQTTELCVFGRKAHLSDQDHWTSIRYASFFKAPPSSPHKSCVFCKFVFVHMVIVPYWDFSLRLPCVEIPPDFEYTWVCSPVKKMGRYGTWKLLYIRLKNVYICDVYANCTQIPSFQKSKSKSDGIPGDAIQPWNIIVIAEQISDGRRPKITRRNIKNIA